MTREKSSKGQEKEEEGKGVKCEMKCEWKRNFRRQGDLLMGMQR